MAFFKKRIKVTAHAFINTEAKKVFGDTTGNLWGILETCIDDPEENGEIPAFVGSITLIAMGLAGLNDAVQLGYSHAVAEIMDDTYGPGRGEWFKDRALGYVATMDRDVASNMSDKLPATLSLALDNIIGRDDETVVMCRLGVLFWTLAHLKTSKEFFEDLKII